MNVSFRRVALISTLFLVACSDKARPDFERCAELEAGKKYDEARKACELAVSKDPESKAGKLAAAKLPVLATVQSESEGQREATQAKLLSGLHRENDRLDTLKPRWSRPLLARRP